MQGPVSPAVLKRCTRARLKPNETRDGCSPPVARRTTVENTAISLPSVLSLAAPLANIDAVQLPVQMHKVKRPVGGKCTRLAPIDFTGG